MDNPNGNLRIKHFIVIMGFVVSIGGAMFMLLWNCLENVRAEISQINARTASTETKLEMLTREIEKRQQLNLNETSLESLMAVIK